MPPKRRGPKLFHEREWKEPKAIVRPQATYSTKRKQEVLMWLIHHRVEDVESPNQQGRSTTAIARDDAEGCVEKEPRRMPDGTERWFRAPTYQEAANFWKIPQGTIVSWWRAKNKIFDGKVPQAKIPLVHPGQRNKPRPEPRLMLPSPPDPPPPEPLRQSQGQGQVWQGQNHPPPVRIMARALQPAHGPAHQIPGGHPEPHGHHPGAPLPLDPMAHALQQAQNLAHQISSGHTQPHSHHPGAPPPHPPPPAPAGGQHAPFQPSAPVPAYGQPVYLQAAKPSGPPMHPLFRANFAVEEVSKEISQMLGMPQAVSIQKLQRAIELSQALVNDLTEAHKVLLNPHNFPQYCPPGYVPGPPLQQHVQYPRAPEVHHFVTQPAPYHRHPQQLAPMHRHSQQALPPPLPHPHVCTAGATVGEINRSEQRCAAQSGTSDRPVVVQDGNTSAACERERMAEQHGKRYASGDGDTPMVDNTKNVDGNNRSRPKPEERAWMSDKTEADGQTAEETAKIHGVEEEGYPQEREPDEYTAACRRQEAGEASKDVEAPQDASVGPMHQNDKDANNSGVEQKGQRESVRDDENGYATSAADVRTTARQCSNDETPAGQSSSVHERTTHQLAVGQNRIEELGERAASEVVAEEAQDEAAQQDVVMVDTPIKEEPSGEGRSGAADEGMQVD